jgi:L-asparagine oxygenase
MVFLQQYRISDSDHADLERFVLEIDQRGLAEQSAYERVSDWAMSLPINLQRALLRFQYDRACDALHIQGIPVGQLALLETPLNHEPATQYPVYGFQSVCLAISRMLGYVVGFATQQHGRLCNNIVPILSDQDTVNISSGYRHTFDFHNEDAFMQYPPDYFQLACVRNPTDTPLTVSGINAGDLPANVEELLRHPHFLIGTNVVQQQWDGSRASTSSVISGPVDHPYLRYNGSRTIPAGEEYAHSTEAALECLSAKLRYNSRDIALIGGDVAVVKNHRLCHARRPYLAKCDGTDRWMIRLVIFRSLRLVEDFMPDPDFPVMNPKTASVSSA